MAKKPRPQKIDAPPPLNNKDHLERVNYALQASLLLRQLGANRTHAAGVTESRDATEQLSSDAASDGRHDDRGSSDSVKQGRLSRAAARQRKRQSKSAKEALGELSRTEVTSLRKWTVHNQVKL